MLSNCLFCNNEINYNPSQSTGKYCNNKCQQDKAFYNKVKKYLSGEIPKLGKSTKRFLIERDGNKCNICNINEWNNKPITLEIEHKDGNGFNDSPINLELLCPNCHSQTDTYKNKNYGNGRKSRLNNNIDLEPQKNKTILKYRNIFNCWKESKLNFTKFCKLNNYNRAGINSAFRKHKIK